MKDRRKLGIGIEREQGEAARKSKEYTKEGMAERIRKRGRKYNKEEGERTKKKEEKKTNN